LRERPEDTRPLAEYFLEEFCRRNNFRPKPIEDDVFAALRGYRWPGNVRELRNVIERITILSVSDTITAESIPLEIRLPQDDSRPSSLEETRAQAERELIRQALEEARGNVSAAARALGIERTRLHKRIRALGLAREES
jgi:two-component system nitrogen regulation response regulator NtrX